MNYIDFRSDVATLLTEQMRQSFVTSQYGDWEADQDQGVKQLQAYAAELLGTEAAAYTPTATFANQCGLMTAGRPGSQVILRDGSHVIQHENGSVGRLARMLTKTVECPQGYLTPQILKIALRKGGKHIPQNSTVLLQFPSFQGLIPPVEQFNECAKMARDAGLHVHVDGARFFSAIAQLKINPHEVTKNCSSITICLSKGLLAPLGSVIVGTKEFIERFKVNQKMLGGLMRKPGVYAGAALIALKKMRLELWKDNQITRLLAKKLLELGWIQIVVKVETNIIFYKITDPSVDTSILSKFLVQHGVYVFLVKGGINRFVIHHYIRQEQVEKLISLLKEYYEKHRKQEKKQQI